MLRELCGAEGLQYDQLAKHVGHQQLPAETPRPPQVKGWRLLSDSQWLQKGRTFVCVVGETAADFIKFANSAKGHPICGVFAAADAERLAHLLNSHWIWSNSEKVNHMHGWSLVLKAPEDAEKLVLTKAADSPFAPDQCRKDGSAASGALRPSATADGLSGG